jgi:CheY-like chemotaxis protein
MAPIGAQVSPSSEVLAKLVGLRQALRDVAAVVEAVGALRSLGGEDALIEMAMFAQSHEQTVERAWKALAECEEAARRAGSSPLAASVSPEASLLAAEIASPTSLPPGASAPASEAEVALATDPAPLPPPELAADLPDAGLDASVGGAGVAATDADIGAGAGVTPDEALLADADTAGDEEGPVTQVDAPPTRVLVVDDDPAVLRAFRRVLQADHEIVTARDGSEALQIVLSGARVDAIICDIGMPKLDGPAFFSELFELRPQLMPRVVFCTGGLPNEKTQRFLDRLQAPLLYKPVAAVDLQHAIDVARAR